MIHWDPKTGEHGMRYRKKPVEIEARQTGQDYDEDCAIVGWCGGRAVGPEDGYDTAIIAIDTLEGTMVAEPGDWIICGVKGEFYPCKPDIFDATYESTNLRDPSACGAKGDEDEMSETRAMRQIRKAASRHGFEVEGMEWQPWTAASEMSGIGGGWMVDLKDDDYVEFLSAAEADEAFALHARYRSPLRHWQPGVTPAESPHGTGRP